MRIVKGMRVVLMLFAVAGCDAQETPSRYGVIDSGFGAYDQPVFWLDERRVIFEGYAGPEPETVEAQDELDHSLYVWDTSTGEVTRYVEGAQRLCLADGYIYYITDEQIERGKPEDVGENESVTRWMEGAFGEETERRFVFSGTQEYRRWRRDHERSPLTGCRLVERPEGMAGRVWVPLRSEHGYVDMGPMSASSAEAGVTFFRAGASEPIGLPFNRQQVGPASVEHYYAFNDSYLLAQYAGANDRWKESNCGAVWWLWLSGETERHCVPAGPWAEHGSALFDASKAGLLYTSHGTASPSDPGHAGVYLVGQGEDPTMRRLVVGFVRGVAVSPDGCRMAFTHVPHVEAMRVGGDERRTVKYVEVCASSM